MTVSSIAAISGPFLGNATATVFPFSFKAEDADEIQVLVDGAVSAGYTASISTVSDGGSVTFTIPPANGAVILIVSNPAFTQEVAFEDAGQFLASSHDDANDRAAIRDIYLKACLARSILAPWGEALNGLPPAAARAGQYLAFDAGGQPIPVSGMGADASLRTELAVPTGASLIGFLQSGTGAAARTVQAKLRDTVSIKDFGAVGDGTTNDKAAIEAAAALGIPILIPSGTYRITGNSTLSCPLIFMGGTISADSGSTLTLRGVVTAPLTALFSGLGSVVGIRDVCPEWFGAVRDGATDDLAPLNKAHTCVQGSKLSKGGRQQIRLQGGGSYGVSGSWVVAPSADVGLVVTGAGTGLGGSRLTDIAAFSSTTTPVFQVDGQTDSIQKIADWGLNGFAVVKGAGAATIGIQLGSTNSAKSLIGETWQKVEDVNASGFANDWKLCHVRQILFSRVSGWNQGYVGACIPLLITTNGGFTGDLVFDDACQLVSNDATTVGTKCIRIECSSGDYNNTTGANSVSGIRFGNLDLYKGEKTVDIYCSNGGYISDIWFDRTQFDQPSTNEILITSDKTTATTPVIQNINVSGCYLSGNIGASIKLASAGTGGVIREIDVSGNYSTAGQGEFVQVGGVSGGVKSLTVSNNRILNNNNHTGTGYVINLDTVDGATCNGNRLSRSDGASFPNYMVNIASGANHYVVRGNSAHALCATGIVNDGGGAVTKSVGDNI